MIYDGLTAALATQHGKERAIAPPFAARTGLAITVPGGIDTDSLGTFTGETPRPGSMRETARRKARLGMEAAGLPIGIASEGSFGPHPVVPFLAAGRELMILIDDVHGIEVVEESVSTHTNFAALELEPDADVAGFLARVGFPAHAVVLRWGERVIKGIDTRAELDSLLSLCTGNARLETDMRAHVNPTRMTEIGALAATLAERMARLCPACAAPGYGIVRRETGLPCADCGAPTPLINALVAACALCGHESTSPRIDGRAAASPAECPECNP
jgi:hypothetical protein